MAYSKFLLKKKFQKEIQKGDCNISREHNYNSAINTKRVPTTLANNEFKQSNVIPININEVVAETSVLSGSVSPAFPGSSGVVILKNELDTAYTNKYMEQRKEMNEIRSNIVASHASNLSNKPTNKELSLKNERNLFRKKYIEVIKEKNKAKIENARLTKELQKYKESSEKLTLEMHKTSQISPTMAVCLSNVLKNQQRVPKSKRYDNATKLIALAIRHLNPVEYRKEAPKFKWPSTKTLQRFLREFPELRPDQDLSEIETLPDFLL